MKYLGINYKYAQNIFTEKYNILLIEMKAHFDVTKVAK